MKKIDTIVEIQKTLFEIEKLLHKVSFFWDQSQDGFPPKKGPWLTCLPIRGLSFDGKPLELLFWLGSQKKLTCTNATYYDFRPQLWCHLQDGCLGFGGTFPSDVKCILGHWCYFFQRVSFFITKVCFKEPKKIYIHIQLFGRGAVFYFWLEKPQQKNFTRCVAKIKGRTFGGDISCCNTHRGLNNDKK